MVVGWRDGMVIGIDGDRWLRSVGWMVDSWDGMGGAGCGLGRGFVDCDWAVKIAVAADWDGIIRSVRWELGHKMRMNGVLNRRNLSKFVDQY